MKTVARLMLAYFTCTPLARWMTGLGILSIAAGTLRLVYSSQGWTFWLLIAAGSTALFFGSTAMPLIVWRCAIGHHMYVLPHARWKLLVSAFATIALVALATALPFPIAFHVVVPEKIAQAAGNDFPTLFSRMYAVAIANITLMYAVIWIVATRRTATARLGGAMLLIAIMFGPTGTAYVFNPSRSLLWPCVLVALLWGGLALYIIRLAQIKKLLGFIPVSRMHYASGHEIELLLGAGRPWRLATVQALPIIVATGFIQSPGIWLFYLTIFSMLSAAITSAAAARSRSVWLRTRWSRLELFAHTERLFWRHNSHGLAVLLFLLAAIGSYEGLPPSLLAIGALLLIVGSVLSTYLGLMMTRGLDWFDIAITVTVMLALMAAAALAATESVAPIATVALLVLLLLVAFGCRGEARRRWSELDWMACRPVTGRAQRSAL